MLNAPPAENTVRQWALAANHAVASREGLARIIAAGFVPVDDDTSEKFARLWAQEAPIWGRLLQARWRAAQLRRSGGFYLAL